MVGRGGGVDGSGVVRGGYGPGMGGTSGDIGGSGAERWVSKGEKRVTVTPGRSATGSQEIGDGWRRDLGDCEA